MLLRDVDYLRTMPLHSYVFHRRVDVDCINTISTAFLSARIRYPLIFESEMSNIDPHPQRDSLPSELELLAESALTSFILLEPWCQAKQSCVSIFRLSMNIDLLFCIQITSSPGYFHGWGYQATCPTIWKGDKCQLGCRSEGKLLFWIRNRAFPFSETG